MGWFCFRLWCGVNNRRGSNIKHYEDRSAQALSAHEEATYCCTAHFIVPYTETSITCSALGIFQFIGLVSAGA